ncbi:MAG: GerMN domain-containing protein [bacterium]
MKALKLILFVILLAGLCGCSVPNKGVKVYFFQEGKLVPTERALPTIENPVVVAIDQLLRGPNEQEAANGFTTKIPAGTRSRGVDVEGRTAIVDLNSTLLEYEGSSSRAKDMVAQIVYTATSVRGIKEVILKLQGSDQFVLGPDYVIDHPLSRDDIKI